MLVWSLSMLSSRRAHKSHNCTYVCACQCTGPAAWWGARSGARRPLGHTADDCVRVPCVLNSIVPAINGRSKSESYHILKGVHTSVASGKNQTGRMIARAHIRAMQAPGTMVVTPT
jgi:hypothetical protein